MVDVFGLDKSDIALLQSLIPERYENIELYTKGKRGVIFTAFIDGGKVAIKIAHPNSDARQAITLECSYLGKVNRLGIGPQLIDWGDSFVAMEFVDGQTIAEFLENASAKDIRIVLREVFDQLVKLDEARINKFELTNPYKHILVTKDLRVVLIDFERARFTARPKNVSQFAEYVLRTKELLATKELPIDEVTFREIIFTYQEEGILDLPF